MDGTKKKHLHSDAQCIHLHIRMYNCTCGIIYCIIAPYCAILKGCVV